MRPGAFPKLRFMAVRTITCRVFCVGSRRTSASTTSIIYAVEFPAIGCRTCSGIIRNSLPWDGSPSSRVCGVCRGPCRTRRGGGSFRFERRTLAKSLGNSFDDGCYSRIRGTFIRAGQNYRSGAAIRCFLVLPGSRYRDDEVSNCQCPACRWGQHEGCRRCSSDAGRSANSFGG
jgi:hypothetical protein